MYCTLEILNKQPSDVFGGVVVQRTFFTAGLRLLRTIQFSLTRSLAQKLVIPAFEKDNLSRKTCQFVSYTRAN